MDCDITAAKVIHFIHPVLLANRCSAATQRYCIWELLKSSFERNDQTLIAQFERHPSLHYLRIAVTDLLTLHLKQDATLQIELNRFLNAHYDIEMLNERTESTTGSFNRSRSIRFSRMIQPLKRVRKMLPLWSF